MPRNERTDEQYRELLDAIRAGHEPSRAEVVALCDWADSLDQAAYLTLERAKRDLRRIEGKVQS